VQTYYRTGDLVRVDPDGVMVFLGRVDRQAKVRGYRIELDEIEATLVAHRAVEEAAIFTVTDEQGQAEIRGAFLPAAECSTFTAEDCLAYLKERLPWYAVPTSLRALPQFPRTSTGKIDRQVLCSEESQ
jgi:acyl-coenzyme A synthetase/AMP-(fatty) acid ligase